MIASIDADETDRIVGLELGADDYVAKPFSTPELLLRMKKLMAGVQGDDGHPSACLRFDGVVIDASRHSVLVNDRPAELTATEFRLLELLARRSAYVHSRGELLELVWKTQSGVDDRTVDTHVRRLRQKLGSAGRMLETVRGFGYRFANQSSHRHR